MKFDYVGVNVFHDYLDFSWGCELGFGHLITDGDFNILDNENMSNEFCQEVIKEGMKTLKDFLERHGGVFY